MAIGQSKSRVTRGPTWLLSRDPDFFRLGEFFSRSRIPSSAHPNLSGKATISKRVQRIHSPTVKREQQITVVWLSVSSKYLLKVFHSPLPFIPVQFHCYYPIISVERMIGEIYKNGLQRVTVWSVRSVRRRKYQHVQNPYVDHADSMQADISWIEE